MLKQNYKSSGDSINVVKAQNNGDDEGQGGSCTPVTTNVLTTATKIK
jgi:hypothetical protein